MEMKCVLKEIEEFECFYLTKDNIDDFIKWITRLCIKNNSLFKYHYYNNKLTIFPSNELCFDFELNRWFVWKDSLYDYDEDVFNKIYRRI